MYIRTREQALDAAADALELRDPRDRLVRSAVQVMLCLEVEPRRLLVDCLALFFQGGLDALRRRRQRAAPAEPDTEAVARALDALRFAGMARQVLPGLRHERWQVARAILVNEGGVRACVEDAIRARGDAMTLATCESAVTEMVLSLHQAWMDRAGTLRTACLGALKGVPLPDPDRLHEEADLLFELVATSDRRATDLLQAIDLGPEEAAHAVERLYAISDALRSTGPDSPHHPPGPSALRDVA